MKNDKPPEDIGRARQITQSPAEPTRAEKTPAEMAVLTLSARYPQLCLPIRAGMRETDEYKNAVLRGLPVKTGPDFFTTPQDSLTVTQTPAGPAEVLYLADRRDFEHAFQALAYRCEPVKILPSVGAGTIRGLINWEKIRRRRSEYLLAGGTDWPAEFKRFTADKSNYTDTLILLSGGDYSAVPSEELGLEANEWRAKSLTIRKYHELTHFIYRSLRPDDVDVVRDEVIADMIGMTAAFGDYDAGLALRFLGVDGEKCRPEGRLAHYVPPEMLGQAAGRVRALTEEYARMIGPLRKTDPMELLTKIFRI